MAETGRFRVEIVGDVQEPYSPRAHAEIQSAASPGEGVLEQELTLPGPFSVADMADTETEQSFTEVRDTSSSENQIRRAPVMSLLQRMGNLVEKNCKQELTLPVAGALSASDTACMDTKGSVSQLTTPGGTDNQTICQIPNFPGSPEMQCFENNAKREAIFPVTSPVAYSNDSNVDENRTYSKGNSTPIKHITLEPSLELDNNSKATIIIENDSGNTQTHNYEITEVQDDGVAVATSADKARAKSRRGLFDSLHSISQQALEDASVVNQDDESRSSRAESMDLDMSLIKVEHAESPDDAAEEDPGGDTGFTVHRAAGSDAGDKDEDFYIQRAMSDDEDTDIEGNDAEPSHDHPVNGQASPTPTKLHIVPGSLCPNPATKGRILKNHMKRNGKGMAYLDCTGSDVYLKKHDLICQFCSEMFPRQCLFVNHERSHVGLPPLDCKHCTKKVHEPGAKTHMCQFCGKGFGSKSGVSEHEKRHREERTYCCPHCDKTYKTRDILVRHIRIHTGEKRYKCNYCDKRFSDFSTWKVHERIHTGERPYKCPHCGRAFRQTCHMKTHINAEHTAAERYDCKICGKSFLRKDSLYSHTQQVHQPKSKEKPYKCEFEFCDKMFRTKGLRRSHHLVHTEVKEHKCEVCEKMFKKKNQLRIHQRMHTDVRPYKCEFCPKSFRQKGTRDQHHNIHTGDRPFKCAACDQTFAAQSTLHNHQKMHKRGRTVADMLNTPKDSIELNTLKDGSVACGVQGEVRVDNVVLVASVE